jgi:peptide/nickel transport system substrate-binding protein
MPQRTAALLTAALLLSASAIAQAAPEAKVLRIAPHSNLTILDPIWTTTYIARNHGYMIYDTLFGMDAKGKIQPQMVDKWDTSKDGMTWTFTLRDGLEFHDGKPVTSEDVIASIARWGKRDSMGEMLMSFVSGMQAVSAKTFRLTLKEPYGLVLESLGKPSSNVPFIMPKRVADTPADKQIDDFTGSGPFIFKREEWKPGEVVVYVKNPNYKPRAEAPSGTAGGKVVKFDRVEWAIIKDPQTQANALVAGEIDIIEAPAHELYATLKNDPNVQIVDPNPLGWQIIMRFNHLQPPFDNPKVRRAAMAALNQPAFLRAQIGVPEMYRSCFSIYPCNSAYFSTAGMDFIAHPDVKRARQLLNESGYDGRPIVLMQATDVAIAAKTPIVAAQLLRQAGFKVDTQAMDWQTLVARRTKKTPPSQGGWNIFMTWWASVDQLNPITMNSVNAGCDKAWFGWPCDAELQKMREEFAVAADDATRKKLAERIQVRAMEIGTHAPLGEFTNPVAARKNLKGFVTGFLFVPWNIERQ